MLDGPITDAETGIEAAIAECIGRTSCDAIGAPTTPIWMTLNTRRLEGVRDEDHGDRAKRPEFLVN